MQHEDKIVKLLKEIQELCVGIRNIVADLAVPEEYSSEEEYQPDEDTQEEDQEGLRSPTKRSKVSWTQTQSM